LILNKNLKFCFGISLSFQWKIKNTLSSLLYWLGYISLIGPSRMIEIKNNSDKEKGELSGFSIYWVLLSETAIRSGIFLIIGWSIELLMSEKLFEMYRVDYLLGTFMVAGFIHLIAYYVGLVIIVPKSFNLGMKFYRLGRNIAYAFLPAILAAIFILIFQTYEQIELYSGNQVQLSFYIVYLVFIAIGIVEAFSMQGKALNIGSIK